MSIEPDRLAVVGTNVERIAEQEAGESSRSSERTAPVVFRVGTETVVFQSQFASVRVLIANERADHLDRLAEVVMGLGHSVVARETDVRAVGATTSREHPDVALVGLGISSRHALELIEQIVHESSCPVIALLSSEQPGFIREAAKRGVFAYIVDTVPEELQGAIDIALQRFAEFHSLQAAFGRRALIEQAKGILMALHVIDGDRAFAMLRAQSHSNGGKLTDAAAAIVDRHLLLVPNTDELRAST